MNKKVTPKASLSKKKTPIKLDSSLSWRPKLKPLKRPASIGLNDGAEQLDEKPSDITHVRYVVFSMFFVH